MSETGADAAGTTSAEEEESVEEISGVEEGIVAVTFGEVKAGRWVVLGGQEQVTLE